MDAHLIKKIKENPYKRKWKTVEIELTKRVPLNEFIDFLRQFYFEKTKKKIEFTPFYKSESIIIHHQSDGKIIEHPQHRKGYLEQIIYLLLEPKNMVTWKKTEFTKKNITRLNNERNLFRVYGLYELVNKIEEGDNIGEILTSKKYTVNLNEGYRSEFRPLLKALKNTLI